MSPRFIVRGAIAGVVLAIPLCLMLPGLRPRLPSPRLPQMASTTPFGTIPSRPIPASLVPAQSDITDIGIEYREPLPADGDMGALRIKVYAEVQKDCDAAAKAFQEHCSVSSINFADMPMNGLPQEVVAHAQLSLAPDAKPTTSPAPN